MPSLVRRNPHSPDNPYRVGQVDDRGNVICGARCRNGSKCKHDPIGGMGRCKKHGGKSKVGIEHHNAKHLIYSSQTNNANIGKRYADLLERDDLVSLQHEIALITAHIQDKEALLEAGFTKQKEKDFIHLFQRMHDEYLNSAGSRKFQSLLAEMADFVDGLSEAKSDRSELTPLLAEKRRLVSAEQKRMVLAEQMVTVKQVLTLLTAQMIAIREAAYLYTSKEEAEQIISHAQGMYKRIVGEGADEKYHDLVLPEK